MYLFYTTCEDSHSVGEYGEDINEMTSTPNMVDIDNEIFINTIAKNAGFKENVLEVFSHDSERQLIDDFALSCHKSHFQGQDCYYIRFSGIEHIFVHNEQLKNLLTGDEAQERRDKIEALDDLLNDDDSWNAASTNKEHYDSLLNFTTTNKSVFEENNIHLGSLFAYGHNYGKIVQMVDKEVFFLSQDPDELSM